MISAPVRAHFRGVAGIAPARPDRSGRRVACLPGVNGDAAFQPYAHDFEGKLNAGEPRGQDCQGWNSLNRFYRATDDWLFISVPVAQEAVLRGQTGIAAATDLAPGLSAAFAGNSVENWVARLHQAGLCACRVAEFPALLKDKNLLNRNVIYTFFIANMGPTFTTSAGSLFFLKCRLIAASADADQRRDILYTGDPVAVFREAGKRCRDDPLARLREI